ncbi:hypothetical protein FQR65_LT07532 [Abscondita terminalis]|nr:hypothetical protein FQR65_LT07532 [Abscondita terminalis]
MNEELRRMNVKLRTTNHEQRTAIPQAGTFPPNIRIEWNKFDERAVTLCTCRSGVDPSLVQKMIQYSQYTNDPCFMCYLSCLITERGLMDGNGDYIVDALVLHMANITRSIAVACVNASITLQDPCKKAYDVGLCLMDKLSV